MTTADRESLRRMDWEYQDLTGKRAHLYAYKPGDGLGGRYVFTGGTRFGLPKALRHMKGVLDGARREPQGGNDERGEHR